MPFTVTISARAERDIRKAHHWIKERSQNGARSCLDTLGTALQGIAKLGKSSVKAPEAEELSIDLRQYTFKTRHGRPYRLIFVIKETKIEVLTLRGSWQNRLKSEEM